MSDHLPECFFDPIREQERQLCICDRLRACENRVRANIDREGFVLDAGDPYQEVYRKAYTSGVLIERERVMREVRALAPLLDVDKRHGGYDCCGCTTPGDLLADVLDAVDAPTRSQPQEISPSMYDPRSRDERP